jgi:catechol 2,3-dioxygenase-like lactoylglutathione lyase family enzyme
MIRSATTGPAGKNRLDGKSTRSQLAQELGIGMATTSVLGRKFHFGLNVADLDRAIAFYRILFGVEPVKHYADYAKFDVDDPPLVLGLNPTPRAAGGALNHVGFRVSSSEALVEVQRRLEAAGIRTKREDGVECCYARQTKFWVPDADHNLWEIYTLEQDLDHSGFGGDGAMPPRPETLTDPVVWEHMLTTPLPQRIPHDDNSVSEVRLEGTFNLDLSAERRAAILNESLRVLRPGGRISVHALVSDRPLDRAPSLPGPAMLVQHIPCESVPQDELAAAGFTGILFEKLGDIHCFKVGEVEFRELQLAGFKPFRPPGDSAYAVIYRGPLVRVINEGWQIFPRGERVAVDEATWCQFRQPVFADQFTCIGPAASATG